ncbi:MAG: LytTR family DNA-binding domain-containing protein [Pseudomonadota bacterium]|nr:LytTR family DNA-binding domain-containing protein [Pseudomonadota bacterium]
MKEANSKKLTTIIVDDEELARQGLAMRLEEVSEIEILAQCQNGREALNAINEYEPDLAFLDIQMPGTSGLELIGEIQGDVMPMIIFVTAFDEFAVDAFDVHAVDYLLKPVESNRLKEAINKAQKLKMQEGALGDKQKLLELAASLSGKSLDAIGELLESGDNLIEHADRLAIKDGTSLTFVPVKDIDWIDAAGDYMCVHAKGETHIMRTTMKELEARLAPSIFQRVHRSTIVNLERVEKISSHINGEFHLILGGGISLKMSRSYKNKVKHFFRE